MSTVDSPQKQPSPPRSEAIRTYHLQRDAFLNMGNCLYSIMLAVFVAATILELQQSKVCVTPPLALCQTKATLEPPLACVARLSCFLTMVLLCIYYSFDWYDLNRVPYFDQRLGMGQMVLYSACVVLITALTIFSLTGQVHMAMWITAAYHPFVLVFRDRPLRLEPHKQRDKAVAKEEHPALMFLHRDEVVGGLKIVGMLAFGAIYILLGILLIQNSASRCIVILASVALPVAWGVGLYLKVGRSINFIRDCYNRALSRRAAHQLRLLRAALQGIDLLLGEDPQKKDQQGA